MTFLGPLVAAVIAGAGGGSEKFELFTYTPPSGWMVLDTEEGRRYVRQEEDGNGLIVLLAGRPTGDPPAAAFAAMWRDRAARYVPEPPPEPSVRRSGDLTTLTGTRKVLSRGAPVSAAVVTVVGRGRVLGVVGIATGDALQAQVAALLEGLEIETAPTAAVASAAETGTGGAGEIGYEVPRGYLERPEATKIVLLPETFDARTPCVYGLAPPRRARGSLEADAEAALLEVVGPGWRRLDERRSAMRGSAAAGWPYAWVRAAFQREEAGTTQVENAMAMALPAGPGRVNVVWGRGDPARCRLHDGSFEQLFHSLEPGGWTSDGGMALARDLLGTWRTREASGTRQLVLGPDGRYEHGAGTVARGHYTLRGDVLVLTPDDRPRDPERYRVRVYDRWAADGWKRSLALLDERAGPPLAVRYVRAAEPAP